jgi:hypothetical protein
MASRPLIIEGAMAMQVGLVDNECCNGGCVDGGSVMVAGGRGAADALANPGLWSDKMS